MKTKIAALALLLLASAGTQALAQEHRGGRQAQPTRMQEDGPDQQARSREMRAERPPEAPRAERPPEAPRAPEASGERRRGGGEGAGGGRDRRQDRGGGEGRSRWTGGDQTAATPAPAAGGQRDRNGFGEGRRWTGGDRDGGRRDGQRPGADRRDGERHDGDRRDGAWTGRDGRGGDHRSDGDRRGGERRGDNDRWRGDDNRWRDNNDRWRGDNRDNHGRPRWDQRRYPSVYRSQQRYRGHIYRPPVGFYVNTWSFGDILPYGWYGGSYRLADWWSYDLPMPPPGFDWIRVGDDALLIDRFSGRVYQVVRDLFW